MFRSWVEVGLLSHAVHVYELPASVVARIQPQQFVAIMVDSMFRY